MTHFSKYATGFPKEYVLMMDANMLDIFPILNFWWEEGGLSFLFQNYYIVKVAFFFFAGGVYNSMNFNIRVYVTPTTTQLITEKLPFTPSLSSSPLPPQHLATVDLLSITAVRSL